MGGGDRCGEGLWDGVVELPTSRRTPSLRGQDRGVLPASLRLRPTTVMERSHATLRTWCSSERAGSSPACCTQHLACTVFYLRQLNRERRGPYNGPLPWLIFTRHMFTVLD